jgi:hypothetical protein
MAQEIKEQHLAGLERGLCCFTYYPLAHHALQR